MSPTRNTTIDFLRGMAVILMIFVHATAYFLSDKTVHILWDYTHIVVPLFVFCSAFIFFQKERPVPLSLTYIAKRLKRLVIPYYIYLILFFILAFFSSPHSVTVSNIINQALLGQGRDLGWLVFLFTYLIFLIPIIHFMYKSSRWLFMVFALASAASTILLLFYTVPVPFRLIMWLPWSFFLIVTLYISQYHKNKYFIFGTLLLSSVVFLITRDLLGDLSKSLVLTENKYPPNINYLSYGVFFTVILYQIHRFVIKLSFFEQYVQKWFDFFSTNSYSLFFIHFLYVKFFVDFGFHRDLGWWWFFVVLTILSTVTQIGINISWKLQVSKVIGALKPIFTNK